MGGICFEKIICIIFSIILILSVFSVPAFAASSGVSFDNSSVVDDLESIYGDDLYVKYPMDKSNDDIYLIDLFEYGFSDKKYHNSSDYGLFFYIYNPSGKDILGSIGKIQFAVDWKYNSEKNEYEPVSYEKFSVYMLSSDDSNVLMKFKVITDGKALYFYDKFYKSRQYDISGVEIYENEFDAEDYSVGTSYVYSGYAKGFSSESAKSSTLTCTRHDLFTIRVVPHQVTYISGDSGKGKGYSNQVSSVYFSLPKDIEKTYGKLYSIKYEYEHYYTSPMIVTDNSGSFNALKNDIGKKVDPSAWEYSLFTWTDRFLKPGLIYENYLYYADIWYGEDLGIHGSLKGSQDSFQRLLYDNTLNYITSVFYNPDEWSEGSVILNFEDVLVYFRDYSSSYYTNNGKKICGYSPDLFDLNKSDRYIVKTSNINDTFSLDSYDDTHNLFQKWWDYGFTFNEYNKTILNAKYIEHINDSSFVGSSVSDVLLVQDHYLNDLHEYYDNVSGDENVYLLRFAYADNYYTTDVKSSGLDGNFLLCQSNVYLDFDFIEFGFGDETDLTIIPAVSNPVDVLPDIIPTDPDAVDPDPIFPGIQDIFPGIQDSLWSDDGNKIWIIVTAVVLILTVVVIIIFLILKNPRTSTVIYDNIKRKNKKKQKKSRKHEQQESKQKKQYFSSKSKKLRRRYNREKKRYSHPRYHKE